MPHSENRKPWIECAGMWVAATAAVKLLLHLYAGRHYGCFGDELYYLACADHLAWGYVDQPQEGLTDESVHPTLVFAACPEFQGSLFQSHGQ